MVPALVCSFRKTAARDGEGEEMLTYKEMCRESERTERERRDERCLHANEQQKG